MKHNWTKVLLSLTVATALFSACKPKPDTDTPFPPAISPSVFIGSQNQFIYALDPTTGLKKWECFIGSNIESSPVLYNDILFVGNSSSTLYKLDPNNGTKGQSKFGIFPSGMTTTPIGNDGFLYMTSGNMVYGLDIKPDTMEWSYKADGIINSSPTIKDTQLVFGCDDGYVYMLDHRKGNLIWKSKKKYATIFPSSPAMDTALIYIGAEDGNMYCLRRKDGSEVWASNTGAPVKSSPLVLGGNVIFGSDNNKLYCLQNTDGAARWITTTSDRIRCSPYLHGQVIYVGSYDKNFYAINALDGSVRWSFKTNGLIKSSPVVYDGKVFFGSYDKYLYAADTANGAQLWRYAVNGLIDCSPSVDVNNGSGINSTISGASIY